MFVVMEKHKMVSEKSGNFVRTCGLQLDMLNLNYDKKRLTHLGRDKMAAIS